MLEVIAPLVWRSYGWAGNDGNWSTFEVNVGTPPQNFQLLPSTAGGEVWLPIPEACIVPYPDCPTSRGILSTQGDQAQGFQTNESTSWVQIGIYELGFEEDLYGDVDAGLYGQDVVALGSIPAIQNQTIAGIATSDFWLGSIGLGVQPPQFDVVEEDIPTILSALKAQNRTPSVAFGYNAGAAYRGSTGGLVLGGYDQDAIDVGTALISPVYFNGAGSLSVSLRSLVVSKTQQGTIAIPIVPGGFNMSIDSTISQLWLPEAVCDELSDSLGLEYDTNTQLYLMNATARERLLNSAPEFTFTVSDSGWSNRTINIVLPIAALDLEVKYPYYNSSKSYFPIRRAGNETQYVLGRAFLQEAYIIVDWERQNFTLGQSLHVDGVSDNILPILPPGTEVPESLPLLSNGEIAGIAVGGAAVVAITIMVSWMLWRRNRHRNAIKEEHAPDCPSEKTAPFAPEGPGHQIPVSDHKELPSPFVRSEAELMSEERYEAHGNGVPHQLMSNEVYELSGNSMGYELHAQSGHKST